MNHFIVVRWQMRDKNTLFDKGIRSHTQPWYWNTRRLTLEVTNAPKNKCFKKMEGKFVNKIWFWCTIQNDFVWGGGVHLNAVNYSTGGVRRINAEINTVVVGLNWMPFRVGIRCHPWLRFKLDESVRKSQWRRYVLERAIEWLSVWQSPLDIGDCFIFAAISRRNSTLAFQSPQTATRIKVEDVSKRYFFITFKLFYFYSMWFLMKLMWIDHEDTNSIDYYGNSKRRKIDENVMHSTCINN